MRLLDTRTGEFRWIEDPRQVRYAILSHVWAKEGDPDYAPEQTYQDIRNIQMAAGDSPVLPRLSDKIRRFCEVAQRDGFELGWVDSCCIDKTSSSELSEAINSMYNWYRYAGACYVFLHDVSAAHPQERREQFRSSKWFTRGWTLQELIAPSVLLFLSKKWDIIGSKHTLAALVESVTGIERAVLTLDIPPEDVSVARRMSWASSRVTSREEDEAYSLMGIFGVNMPTTYGEGRYAFIRLQEEILRHIPDQTIFAWGPILSRHRFVFSHPSGFTAASTSQPSPIPIAPSSKQYLLASSPRDFSSSSQLTHISREAFAEKLGVPAEAAYQVYTMTSYGIQARFPLVAVLPQDAHTNVPTHLALLACEDPEGRLLALLLRPQAHASGTEYFVGTIVGRVRDLVGSDEPYSGYSGISTLWSYYSRATYLTLQQVDYCLRRGFFEMAGVYISHRPSYTSTGLERDASIHAALREARESFEVRLSGWSRKLLLGQGYRVSPGTDADVALRDRVLSRTLSASMSGLVISSHTEYISIQVGRCNCEFGARFGLLGVLVTSRTSRCVQADQFADEPHFVNHPVHIHSWAFRCGTASKELELESRTGALLTLRLTFTHEASNPVRGSAKAYRLGAEIWPSGDSSVYHADDEGAMGWWDEGERPHPLRRHTQYDGDADDTPPYLQPPPHPPPIQRTRSNSAPDVPETLPLELLDGDVEPDMPVYDVPQAPAVRNQRVLGLGPAPSAPLTSSESSGRNSALQNDHRHRASRPPPRGYSHVQYPDDMHRPRPYPSERAPPHHGSARQTYTWTPTPQAQGEWDAGHHQLGRSRSLTRSAADPQLQPSSGSRPLHWDDNSLMHDDGSPSNRRYIHPRVRETMSDDEGGHYVHHAMHRRATNIPRTVATGNAQQRQPDLSEPEQYTDPGSRIPNVLRSDSPEPMTVSEPEELGSDGTYHSFPIRKRGEIRMATFETAATMGRAGQGHRGVGPNRQGEQRDRGPPSHSEWTQTETRRVVRSPEPTQATPPRRRTNEELPTTTASGSSIVISRQQSQPASPTHSPNQPRASRGQVPRPHIVVPAHMQPQGADVDDDAPLSTPSHSPASAGGGRPRRDGTTNASGLAAPNPSASSTEPLSATGGRSNGVADVLPPATAEPSTARLEAQMVAQTQQDDNPKKRGRFGQMFRSIGRKG